MKSDRLADLNGFADNSLKNSLVNKSIVSKGNPMVDNSIHHGLRKSSIEWTEYSWNPMIGCSHASEECRFCYAERLALKMQEDGIPKYVDGFKPKFLPRMLREPTNLLNPTVIFVNSMGDLLHVAFTIEQIKSVIQVIRETPWHVCILLTKRHERLAELDQEIEWPDNLIMGVSIGINSMVKRADYLRQCDAKHKVISVEPLLEDLPDLDLTGIDWVITGGESGVGARPFDPQWAEHVRLLAQKSGTAFFHKQNGGIQKHRTGRKLFGQIYNEYPAVIRNMKR
jgi:protein gp37